MTDDFTENYQWKFRPQHPARPNWFRAWPGEAQISVQIIVLHEWESAPWHRSRPMPVNAHYKFDFLSLGGREYGARHGIWRLLDVLDKHQIKASVLANGLTAELFPVTVRVAREHGHEIAAHQWDQSVFPPMFQSREEERAALLKTKNVLEKVSGEPVRGYMSPGPRSTPHTLELLTELGFRWTCEYVDCDFPYTIAVKDKNILAISYATPGLIDYDIVGRGPSQALADMKYTFDAVYEESKQQPMKFCYAVHTHWGGTAGMARMLDDFLQYVRSREAVWFARYCDIEEFWAAAARAS
jgi:peptidoglycan/xylan/chitin deacetylase (PgdA/CDA1 family)